MPYWISSGVTHAGTGFPREQVKFGNVFHHDEKTTWPNYYAIGADYTTVSNRSAPGVTNREFLIGMYENGGPGGGSRLKADGTYFCDMRGTGSDDYVWIAKDGTLTLFENIHEIPSWGHRSNSGNPDVPILIPGEDVMGGGHVRKEIHLADSKYTLSVSDWSEVL